MARLRYLQNARTGTAGTICKSTYPLQFYDDDMYIKATADGALKIYADTSLTLESTTITINGAFAFSGTDTLNLGTSGSPLTLTAGTPVMTVYTTCSGAVGTVAQPILFNTVLTGAGQLGGRVRVNMATEVTLGSYANAFKASVDLGTNGGVTGLLSVVCSEMTMATANISGTYAIEEWEMTYASTGSGSLPKPCFVYANSNGTARTVFDDYGDFIIFGTGFTAATGHMFGAGTSTIRLGTGALGATKRYIPLSTAEASYTTAYPIVSTCATTAITIGAAATGISISGTYTTASSRAIKSAVTINNCNLTDGYGTNELDLTITGTGAGHIAAASSWLNIPSGTHGAGGNFLTPLTVGVWEASAATITGATLIFGMRMQAILGDTDVARLCPLDLNVSGDTIDAIWNCPSPTAYMNYAASTNDGESGIVPFIIDSNGRVWYVRLYDS